MIVKGPPPLETLHVSDLAPLIAAYFEIDQLKQLYRQGWLRRGVPPERCETVAEHVFGMALLGWWIADAYFPGLDRDKITRMTLAHELGEVYVGDITPADGMPAGEKLRQERAALERVVGKLPRGAEYLALWEEFEAAEPSPEARFVKQLDRLEMALQAAAYQLQGFGDMQEFLASAAAALTDAPMQALFDQLITLLRSP